MILASVGIGMIRSLGAGAPRAHDPEDAVAPSPDVRIVYRCSNCGTEVLLLRKGADAPLRHCGEQMTMREEIART